MTAPLMNAVLRNEMIKVKFLVEAGADLTYKYKLNKNVLTFAKESFNENIQKNKHKKINDFSKIQKSLEEIIEILSK